jgi:serine protease Do
MIADRKPGTGIELTILRNGKKKELDFKLGNRADYIDLASGNNNIGEKEWLGIRAVALDSPQARQMNVEADAGVVILSIDFESPAHGKLLMGDVIIEINRQPVENLQDYRKIVDELGDKKDAILFRVIRNGRKTYEAVKP